jgi:hypothetical protein
MNRLALPAALAALALSAPTAAAKHDRCHTRTCFGRVLNKHKRAVVKPYRPFLARVRACEWDPIQRWRTNTGNGFFGAYQFTLQSWHGVGGRGLPHQAGQLEQSYRAVLLLRVQGPGAWPVCGR